METFVCETCNKQFENYRRNRAPRKFCSWECRKRKLTYQCHTCKSMFMAYEQHSKSGMRFCSRVCHLVHRRSTEKFCPHCRKYYPRTTEWFYHHQHGRRFKDGLFGYCKSCAREMKKIVNRNHLRQRFGVLPTIGDKCGICGLEYDPGATKQSQLVSDHNHSTGILRGFLCSRHNIALGSFNDDPAVLRAAIAYLEREVTSHRV